MLVIYKDMPCNIRGLSATDSDGIPVMILNSRLTHERNKLTYAHEKSHVQDFGQDQDVNSLELIRHEQ